MGHGSQYAELNANQMGTLQRQFRIFPGLPVSCRIFHRGRGDQASALNSGTRED
jgi:hypothetical protein